MTDSDDMTGAIVIGASGAIGNAMAGELERRGRSPTIRLSRQGPIAIDLADVDSIGNAMGAIGRLDRISHVVIATGILHDGRDGPEKSLRALDAGWLARQFAINTIGPAMILSRILPQLSRTMAVRVAVLSARVGSIADNRLGGWYGYRASKAALNQIIRTAAIEWARTHPHAVLAALHPGTVRSALSDPFIQRRAADGIADADQRAGQLLDVLETLEPSQSGRIFDYQGREILP